MEGKGKGERMKASIGLVGSNGDCISAVQQTAY